MKRPHSVTAMSAIPMGMPGWPAFAAWTASMARALMVSTASCSVEGSPMVGEGTVSPVFNRSVSVFGC